MNQVRLVIVCGALLMVLAIVFGAFGAHALTDILERNNKLKAFTTASQYHFYHAFALLLLGVLMQLFATLKYKKLIFILMLLGTLFFCGSLYVLAIFNIMWLGAVTPIGGVLLILSWGMLVIALLKLE